MQIRIIDQRIGSKFPMPKYATEGSAGMDLVACIDEPVKLQSNEVSLIGSGIAIHIGNPELMAVMVPRSGLGHQNGIVLGNMVGIIDSDYQGEISISCWNRSSNCFTINPGDRIAQLVFMPIHRA
ncbi:MAG: dUTP diphosphatase, partial [Candidatus Porifericomitaceae bacterium WSBS_2022_MAG_OTU9]